MQNNNKVKIITGFYGTGKTEFCVNLALKIRQESSEPVSIADLDVINTYFRSREKSTFLTQHGISILGNLTNNSTNLDTPAISGNLIPPILNKEYVIIDLAGSINGLKVLPTFQQYFDKLDFLFVLNPFRPPCGDFDEVRDFIGQAQTMTGYPITGLVNNSNLIRETTTELFLQGTAIVEGYAERLKLPISYHLLCNDIYNRLVTKPTGETVLFTSPMMRQGWL